MSSRVLLILDDVSPSSDLQRRMRIPPHPLRFVDGSICLEHQVIMAHYYRTGRALFCESCGDHHECICRAWIRGKPNDENDTHVCKEKTRMEQLLQGSHCN